MFSSAQDFRFVQFNYDSLEHVREHAWDMYFMGLQWKNIGGAKTNVGFEPRGWGEIEVKYMKM